MKDVRLTVKGYKNEILKGRVIDLVPLKEEFCKYIVELRNKPRNMYYLCQDEKITLESQLSWYKEYLNRDNDLYWCIFKKNGEFIGTVRLYDMDEKDDVLDQGSFMLNEDYASEGPYAAESILMSLDFAFKKLEVIKVSNTIRSDNKKMSSLAAKFGFEFVKDYVLRGTPYKYYLLSEDSYESKRERIDNLINVWISR